MQKPSANSHSTVTASLPESDPHQRRASHWKDEGYPGFSKWMASSDDFLILRRFGQLNIRVLLLMQDRIASKEEELQKIDEDGRQCLDGQADCSSLRHEPLPRREKLLDELKPMLREYSEFLHSR